MNNGTGQNQKPAREAESAQETRRINYGRSLMKIEEYLRFTEWNNRRLDRIMARCESQ